MEAAFPSLLNQLAAQGPLVIAMIFAIWWLQKNSAAVAAKLDAERAASELKFQKERDARLNAMDAHILELEKRSQSCEADRLELWKRLAVAQPGMIEA